MLCTHVRTYKNTPHCLVFQMERLSVWTLFAILLICTVNSQTDQNEGWWRTTPFASLPGMTTQQVLRSILPPDVIPYTPVNSPEESSQMRDYVSAFKAQTRGMEHLHTYTNLFLYWVTPKYLVPPGKKKKGNPLWPLKWSASRGKEEEALGFYSWGLCVSHLDADILGRLPFKRWCRLGKKLLSVWEGKKTRDDGNICYWSKSWRTPLSQSVFAVSSSI